MRIIIEPNYPERSVGREVYKNRDPVRVPKESAFKKRLRETIFGTSNQVQYDKLIAETNVMLQDSYWPRMTWWLYVYSPLDKHYEKDRAWFESKKWLDFVRKRHAVHWSLIMTCEKLATKHHINVLVSEPFTCHGCDTNIRLNNTVIDGYCHLSVQQITPGTESVVRDYIFKEAKERPFIQYEDYYLHQRSPITSNPQGEEYDQPMPENEPEPVWISTISAAT